MATAANPQRVLHTYRTMVRMIQRLPNEKQATSFRKELRTKFRAGLTADQSLDDRLREAGEKIAFLRIATPKTSSSSEQESGRWVYRNGERIEDGKATYIDGRRVVNGFTGNNFDPCMVKRHNAGLKRAGFANNSHAKGLF